MRMMWLGLRDSLPSVHWELNSMFPSSIRSTLISPPHESVCVCVFVFIVLKTLKITTDLTITNTAIISETSTDPYNSLDCTEVCVFLCKSSKRTSALIQAAQDFCTTKCRVKAIPTCASSVFLSSSLGWIAYLLLFRSFRFSKQEQEHGPSYGKF